MSFFKGVLTFNSTDVTTGNIGSAFDFINVIINAIIGILGGGMVLLAAYLAYKFMTADDETKRKNAKGQMIYAIMGVVVVIIMIIVYNTVLKTMFTSTSSTAAAGD